MLFKTFIFCSKVPSKCGKCRFRDPKFKIFPGGHAPGAPYLPIEMCCHFTVRVYEPLPAWNGKAPKWVPVQAYNTSLKQQLSQSEDGYVFLLADFKRKKSRSSRSHTRVVKSSLRDRRSILGERELREARLLQPTLLNPLSVVKLSIATGHAMRIYNCLNCPRQL